VRRIFADTLYWVAMVHRKDQWYEAAVRVSRTLASSHSVTTDDVPAEVLAAFCESGTHLRQRASNLVRNLHQKSTVTVHPHSRVTFLAGLNLYEARIDKGYSLVDCISMNVMRAKGVTEVLTHDNHFAQEGFIILLR